MDQKLEQKPLIQSIHHISLETDSWDESLRFYTEILELTPAAKASGETRRMQLLDTGGNVFLELCELTEKRTKLPDPKSGHWMHLAFRVSDTAGLMDKVKAAGYEVTLETRTIHSGEFHAVIGFFKGPQGELIEAFQEIAPMDKGTAGDD